MSDQRWEAALREVTALPGVRGAVIMSADDGLVVAETAMDDVATADVAALASALVNRSARCIATLHGGPLTSVHLIAVHGALLAVAGPAPLWLVALARAGTELGRLRLVLRDFAAELT